MNNGYGSGKDTRQTALRDLYVSLGGNIADVAEENDINRLIRDLGNVAGGGGGSGGGVLVVTDPDGTLDKTWQEIHDADFAVLKTELPEVIGGGAIFGPLSKASGLGGSFSAVFYIESEGTVEESVYVAETADGYPTLQSQT